MRTQVPTVNRPGKAGVSKSPQNPARLRCRLGQRPHTDCAVRLSCADCSACGASAQVIPLPHAVKLAAMLPRVATLIELPEICHMARLEHRGPYNSLFVT